MKNVNTCFLAASILLLCSCKKETTTASVQYVTANDEIIAVGEPTDWQGAFLSYNGLPPSRFFSDRVFIQGGYARLYSDTAKIDQENYYSTVIRLIIPTSVRIKGDSLNFEAGVKNPLNSAFYSPVHGRDITLYIKGETNEALMNNVATQDVNPGSLSRAGIKLGETVRNKLPQLQHNVEDYETLILQTFNRGVVAYRNDTYLAGLGYGEEPYIGRLKEIRIIFKGSGFIDYVKLYNSANGKLLMSEDFNTDGESSVIWY